MQSWPRGACERRHIRGVVATRVGDNIRAQGGSPPPHVGDRVVDSVSAESPASTACCVAVAAAKAASAQAARSSSLAPLDGHAALAAPR
jgi:hypothetical protein